METVHLKRRTDTSFDIAPRPTRDLARDGVSFIDQAISAMREYGVKIPKNSRLEEARSVLAFGQETGKLMPRHRDDTLGLRALELSHDLKVITATMPTTRIADVRKDLEMVVQGALEPTTDVDWRALQYQSQFIVRAALVRGGIAPSHPNSSSKTKKPDLLWDHGIATYGIEVKRPRKFENVLPRFNDGTQQLHKYGVKGGVVLDLTDCVRLLSAEECDGSMSAAAESLYAEAYTRNNGFKPGYSHVMLAATYARVPWTSTIVDGANSIGVRYLHRVGVLSVAYGSVQGHDGRHLRTGFIKGLESFGEDLGIQQPQRDEV